ncbi:hypothetical protein V5O48_017865, partial [Marasmius crinis-equi]
VQSVAAILATMTFLLLSGAGRAAPLKPSVQSLQGEHIGIKARVCVDPLDTVARPRCGLCEANILVQMLVYVWIPLIRLVVRHLVAFDENRNIDQHFQDDDGIGAGTGSGSDDHSLSLASTISINMTDSESTALVLPLTSSSSHFSSKWAVEDPQTTGPLGSDHTASLAPEILSEIFSFCPRKESIFEPDALPWILGQVSIHTPTIWTSIHVKMDELFGRTEVGSVALLSNVLERSRPFPLHIQIVLHHGFRAAQRVLDLICDESERWASFKYKALSANFRGVRTLGSNMVLPKPVLSMPALREFEVDRLEWHRKHTWGLELLRALRQSPHLEKVILTDTPYVRNIFETFPWKQLVHFEIRFLVFNFRGMSYPQDFATDVISKSPNLQTFGTHDYFWKRDLSLPLSLPPHLDMSCIVDLRLNQWNSQPSGELYWSTLHLPFLQYLTLCGFSDPEKDLNGVTKMLENSSCRLLSISLLGITFLEETAKRILWTSRETLGKISLRGRIIGTSLLECFFSSSLESKAARIFPNLEELEAKFMLVDLEPYDRVLGLEIPMNSSRFHHQLRVEVDTTTERVMVIGTPIPNEVEVLYELGMVLVFAYLHTESAIPTVVENLAVVDRVLTYLETYHGSSASLIHTAWTKEPYDAIYVLSEICGVMSRVKSDTVWWRGLDGFYAPESSRTIRQSGHEESARVAVVA